mmetsp:Transcript_5045/g.12937  ORF Transcript_5045/g.12937 Transcript_5045/m.12937 type:complete len:88 (+) Transcript_5045:465-728(+)
MSDEVLIPIQREEPLASGVLTKRFDRRVVSPAAAAALIAVALAVFVEDSDDVLILGLEAGLGEIAQVAEQEHRTLEVASLGHASVVR